MKKRIISLFLALVVTFSMVCPLAFADDGDTHEHNWTGSVISEFSDTVEGIPISVSVKRCTECAFYKHTYKFFGLSFDFYSTTAYTGIVEDFLLDVSLHIMNVLGKNASAKQYETGGGSAGTGGVGRRPSGYADDSGTPLVDANGEFQIVVYPNIGFDSSNLQLYPDISLYKTMSTYAFAVNGLNGSIRALTSNFSSCDGVEVYHEYRFTAPVSGRYYLKTRQPLLSSVMGRNGAVDTWHFNANQISKSYAKGETKRFALTSTDVYVRPLGYGENESYSFRFYPLTITCRPDTTTINQQTNITINNNTWNGNIYQDNSTNLTYIYPQYTTVNENNETVTNISENPIIYNNETKEYYTYDSVTNNYYYITYVTETPTPTPSPDPTPTPDPGTDPTPTPEPGGDTGDTNSLLDVLVQIRDNMIQGFADIKATLVQGWADLSANFTLAIENLNLNITNIFNKKFPDQSTPETAEPSPSPSPSPEPSPSPTPDPGETPTPTPAPTDKPSGGNTTNNFWNFVFPGGNNDGTENGHKGILWALISLLIAVVTFVLGLGSAYSYVFPFLPAGLVTTIHICVLVLLLFAIIKFVRSFL